VRQSVALGFVVKRWSWIEFAVAAEYQDFTKAPVRISTTYYGLVRINSTTYVHTMYIRTYLITRIGRLLADANGAAVCSERIHGEENSAPMSSSSVVSTLNG
jgi:hypothetical protein